MRWFGFGFDSVFFGLQGVVVGILVFGVFLGGDFLSRLNVRSWC